MCEGYKTTTTKNGVNLTQNSLVAHKRSIAGFWQIIWPKMPSFYDKTNTQFFFFIFFTLSYRGVLCTNHLLWCVCCAEALLFVNVCEAAFLVHRLVR